MALPRGSAQLNTDVRLGILFRWDGAPTDPHEVRQAQLIATDGETVLATFDSFEHVPGSGEYYLTAAGSLLTAVGRHFDKWYYTWGVGEGEQTALQDFYVQETAALQHYGQSLDVGVGYLKGLPPLAPSPQDGITQADLNAAMAVADTMLESLFAADYDISAWRTSPPPLVSALWELLAAAKVLEFRDLRLRPDCGSEGAARLLRAARELTDRLLHGWPERLHLRDADGNLIRPRKDRSITLPRAAAPASDLFQL